MHCATIKTIKICGIF